MRAVGSGFADALVGGQAGDADVQKAAEEEAEEEDGELEGEKREHGNLSICVWLIRSVRQPGNQAKVTEGASHLCLKSDAAHLN